MAPSLVETFVAVIRDLVAAEARPGRVSRESVSYLHDQRRALQGRMTETDLQAARVQLGSLARWI